MGSLWPGSAHRKAALAVCIYGLGLLVAITPARAEVLRILTSMPPAMTDPYVARIKAQIPELDVLVLNKNTVSAVEELLRGNDRAFDIFWASAPESFELLARRGRFAHESGCTAIPAEGYGPFALSSIGWTLRRDGPRAPQDWDDLLAPQWRGQIGMAPPSRSGTAHMTVERFLQVRGWNDGWRYFLALTENLATITSRSFGVTDGIRSGRFDIGLTIDFLAGTAEPELQFHYGTPAILFPAQIGLLAGAGNPLGGCAFIAAVTDDAGQRLLLQPGIGRIPISPRVREAAGDLIPPEIRAAVRSQWLRYNAGLASERYWAVNVIFDLAITDRLDRRRALWTRLHALESRAPAAETAAIRRAMQSIPISELEVRTAGGTSFANRVMELTDLPTPQRDLVRAWQARIDRQLAEIELALSGLEQRGRP